MAGEAVRGSASEPGYRNSQLRVTQDLAQSLFWLDGASRRLLRLGNTMHTIGDDHGSGSTAERPHLTLVGIFSYGPQAGIPPFSVKGTCATILEHHGSDLNPSFAQHTDASSRTHRQ